MRRNLFSLLFFEQSILHNFLIKFYERCGDGAYRLITSIDSLATTSYLLRRIFLHVASFLLIDSQNTNINFIAPLEMEQNI